MRNIIGSPTEGDDFFDRPKILAKLHRDLHDLANVLLADLDQVEEQLSRLLIVLQRDGYVLENASRYAFRSFLLREYWQRRHGQ